MNFFVAVVLFGLMSAGGAFRAAAAEINCGEQPRNLPVEMQERVKGDAEGTANLILKSLGDVKLRGSVDASRSELRQKFNNIDKVTMDQYVFWITCQTIARDTSMSTGQKLEEYRKAYQMIFSSPGGQRVPSGSEPAELAKRPRALVTGHLGLQFKQNDSVVPIEEESDYVAAAELRRAPFEILLPKKLSSEIDRGKLALGITVTNDKRLLNLARLESYDWPPTAQLRKAALERILGPIVDENDPTKSLFQPGNGWAQNQYGSGALTVSEVGHTELRIYTVGFNYLIGDRFDLDKDGRKGVYVSALMSYGKQGDINLMLSASDVYMVCRYMPTDSKDEKKEARRPTDPLSVELVHIDFVD